jgi:hypothetical protein
MRCLSLRHAPTKTLMKAITTGITEGVGLLAESNGMAVGRLRRDHIQRQNAENGLMALLAACNARLEKR